MGCTGSKGAVEVTAEDVYRPPPTSVALFDIDSIDQPWLKKINNDENKHEEEEEEEEEEKKPEQKSLQLLEKLDGDELTDPHRSWSQVSKALEDIKPTLHQQQQKQEKQEKKEKQEKQEKFLSTLRPAPPNLSGFRSVKENSFLIRDREEREKNSNNSTKSWKRRDPLETYREMTPPGSRPGTVVLYTTTLGGVRRTYEDCVRIRNIMETIVEEAGLDLEERDVSLHGEFLKEMREMCGENAAVPRMFVMGRYVGGAEEVEELNESGKLREMMRWVGRREGRKEGGKKECEGCGNKRFVPCLECNGSCKVVGGDGKEVVRCRECNENGLVLCPLCHS